MIGKGHKYLLCGWLCIVALSVSAQTLKDDTLELSVVLEEVTVDAQTKRLYRRKNNPAVDLLQRVIAHRDSASVYSLPGFTSDEYARTSFALTNFQPDFEKGLWSSVQLLEKYIDKSDTASPSITLSTRERVARHIYQRDPRKELVLVQRERAFGLEDVFSSSMIKKNMDALFEDNVNIYNNNIVILCQSFVSPLSPALANEYYQYYIMDTVLVDDEECIDLAFVPVNSESYSFVGHLFIVNDSTCQLKRYIIQTPRKINLNFVEKVEIDQTFERLPNGLWAPSRTVSSALFEVFNQRKQVLARQTRLNQHYDCTAPVDSRLIRQPAGSTILLQRDTLTYRQTLALWDSIRPEPLSFYESSVMELLNEMKHSPKFNSAIMVLDAATSNYVPTVPSSRWGESKWDFGPLLSTLSWNILEGVRLRVGGTTTAQVNPHHFFHGYVAFGTKDLRPKYNLTYVYSVNKKKNNPYEALRHYLSLSAQYDVEEPFRAFGFFDRDNILLSIPFSKPIMKNYQYVFRAKAAYVKEWQNNLSVHASFDFTHNEAADSISYFRRVVAYQEGSISQTQCFTQYNCYEGNVELHYSPSRVAVINRQGRETSFNLDKTAPVFSLRHQIGYLDDRHFGGKGFFYNHTSASVSKRFRFSSFGHLDAMVQAGYIWNRVPYTKLHSPSASTGLCLTRTGMNLMQPGEFLMDQYVEWFATYYFMGWIINRIPYLNKTKLRGVFSFSGVCGHLSNKNNPYVEGNEGLYQFIDAARYDESGTYQRGYTGSPMGKMPYMELTAGLENIFHFIRIDYVRRLTYNDYALPDGIHRRTAKGWGRNGVKISLRFEF